MKTNWKPQQETCIVLDDKTANERSDQQIKDFFSELRTVAQKHGFDMSMYGSRQQVLKAMTFGENVARKFIDGGWSFDYCPQTQYIGASHPQGGKQSILEIKHPYSPADFGDAICYFLNGFELKSENYE